MLWLSDLPKNVLKILIRESANLLNLSTESTLMEFKVGFLMSEAK